MHHLDMADGCRGNAWGSRHCGNRVFYEILYNEIECYVTDAALVCVHRRGEGECENVTLD